MKRENLFMIDLESEEMGIDCGELILRRENPLIKSDRASLDEKLGKAMMKSVLGAQFVMKMLSVLFLGVGVCFAVSTLLNYLESKPFSLTPICIAAALVALAGIFFALGKRLERKGGGSSPMDEINDSYGRLNDISRRDLGVPSDAAVAEVFMRFYNKDSSPDSPYDVDDVGVFEEDGKLCLHHVGFVVAVPIDSVSAVVRLGDAVKFNDWIKDAPYDGEEYSKYHIQKRVVDDYNDEYSVAGCYSIRFSLEDKELEILVPPYEIEPFLEILKIEVTEE